MVTVCKTKVATTTTTSV